MKGKVVVLFTNEPPSEDPEILRRHRDDLLWALDLQIRGSGPERAKACFIVHTRETAGYPYSVVRPLDGAQLKREMGQPASRLRRLAFQHCGREAPGPIGPYRGRGH